MKRVSKDGSVSYVIHPTITQETHEQLRLLSIHEAQPMTEIVRRILTASVARAVSKLNQQGEL